MPSVTFRLAPTDVKASDFLRERIVHEREVVERAVALHARRPAMPRVRGFSALGEGPIMRSDGPLELPPKRGKKP